MANPGEKNISAYVCPKVAQKLREQTSERGQKIYKAVEGALRLWITLTSTEQSQWIENKVNPEPFDEDLDPEIRAFARASAALTKKLQNRAAASKKKRTQHKNEPV